MYELYVGHIKGQGPDYCLGSPIITSANSDDLERAGKRARRLANDRSRNEMACPVCGQPEPGWLTMAVDAMTGTILKTQPASWW